MSIIKAACVQLNSGPEIAGSLAAAEAFIREAAASGAQFIATPENTCHVRWPLELNLESAPSQDEHPGVALFSDLAAELGVWLLIGSLVVKLSDGRLANRSFLFSDNGALVATYDKIHMFDVQVSSGEVYEESATVRPGGKAVVADAGFAKLGLSICYDVRFPHLYRDLAKAGAEMLMVPAAFTVATGKAHWETLLRARAIETGSFVVAPGQVGEHENGRKTWGHSMIVNPWGEVIAQASDKSGVILADLNLSLVSRARKTIPALDHDREYNISYGG